MRDPRDEGLPAEANDADGGLEELYAHYVDRLNRGESLDPVEILAAHGAQGAELLEMLECFIAPGADWKPGPTQLGDYTLARRIGRGGMGVVYDAWQHSMDRRVALKILPAGVAADPRASARFMREAQTAGQLNHPNVVHVHGLGIEENTPYYAMEYVEGETLAQVLARMSNARSETDTPFGTRDGIDYFGRLARAFADVASGLHHAHSKGVIHRDIKPSNLILDPEERLRILDFGLARLEGQESLTVSGDFLGTPLYMSPEQARRKKVDVDHRTDIYSLGATMYEAFCGRPPFRGKDHADTVSRIIEQDPTEPSRINSRIPTDLETIVLKCLRKDPGERYGTAEALAQDLARFVKSEPIEARPEAPWARLARRVRRHRTRLIAAVTLLAAIPLVAWLALSMSRAEYERELALYPGKLREAVGKLDSGAWALWAASPPLRTGIDFRVFEPNDFRDVIDLAAESTIPGAIAELRELTRLCPREPEAHYHLGRAYAITERPALAVEELDRALEVDPTFTAAIRLREKLAGDWSDTRRETQPEDADRWSWSALWDESERLRWRGDQSEAAGVLTELIQRFERIDPPYTGFLTGCYLARASVRLALGEHDLAEEDCVRARTIDPASLASELLLGKVYLSAQKPEMARRTFARLKSRSEILDVLPFLVVSVHLSVPESDVTEALEWAGSVRDEALRERLATYVYLRLSRWDDAVAAGERAVEADPAGLVPRQLLADALVKKVAHGGSGGLDAALRLARACRDAIALDPQNRRSRYLVKAGWESLRPRVGSSEEEVDGLEHARTLLAAAAETAELTLPAGVRDGDITDDLVGDRDIQDGRPFTWRVIDECCPGEVELRSDGLRVTKLNPERGHDAWLVTEEVFSDDVAVQVRADVGEGKVSCNIHVDLGTASLYYAGVFRNGRCEIGRLDYGEKTAERVGDVGPVTTDVLLELRSRGDMIESRVWAEGSERPEEPTLQMSGSALRLGSIGISTNSHPASFRWVRLQAAPAE